eukprot:jgi/Bigna1/73580/fgenesh1_pg.25_\
MLPTPPPPTPLLLLLLLLLLLPLILFFLCSYQKSSAKSYIMKMAVMEYGVTTNGKTSYMPIFITDTISNTPKTTWKQQGYVVPNHWNPSVLSAAYMSAARDTSIQVLFPPETKTLVIGREEDRCDLVLPGKLVSSQHCSLCGSVLRDMSSSLGVTKVNGKAIKEVELHLGDVITISHHTVQHETILVNSIDLGFLTLRNVKVVLLGKKEPLSTPNPKTKPSLPKPEMKNRTFPKFSGEISFYELIPPKVKRKDRNPGSSKEVVARRANNEIAIVRQGEDYARIKRIVDSLVDRMAR